ncbi:lipopolysaccharide-induced tumor necrosis factor-alpha factor homolog isoform X2 [Branchiostoma lanceolatum]|uniref:lipopolysaccharide-induced tumor necrosis factor-alpha factor homolog isoform X2 n=1 Tax=Branchiostoma lanceolatum TaxID=7740 RepID=UPI0034527159
MSKAQEAGEQQAPPPYPGQPAAGQPYYPQQQPGAYPPGQQPGTYPPQQQPGAYPPPQPGQPGAYPPGPQQPGPGQPVVYMTQPPGPVQYPAQPHLATYPQPPPGGYTPQGPGQPPAPPGTTVIVSQPGVIVTSPQSFRTGYPVTCVCPTCHQTVQTRVDSEVGLITWLAMGGLFLVGCWAGCCLIPLCIDELKDARHSCPNCSTHLGTYDRVS